FGGSGSTLVACEQTERSCATIELDEKYCDVIVKRYIELTGSSADVTVQRDGLDYSYEEVSSLEATDG
ncbi:MAG: DNA modification methylase, partial [Sphaerochaetaceae bacterium]|nr:DNA modification methylase [Sphaerochaetaceae bacterium]